MKKEQFLMELERLLWDISEEERQEAMTYYTDYLNDAGEENEEAVIAELKSPEEVARVIKAGLQRNEGSGGFTETGYEEFAGREVPAKRQAAGEGADDGGAQEETHTRSGSGYQGPYEYQEKSREKEQPHVTYSDREQHASYSDRPAWVTVLLTLIGVVVIIGLAIVMLICIAGGVSCLGAGIAVGVYGSMAAGVASIGIGLIFLAVFVLALLCEVLFCQEVLPRLIWGKRREKR